MTLKKILEKVEDEDVKDYIIKLIEENDELKIKLLEKSKKNYEAEFKELVSDIYSACKELKKQYEFDEDKKELNDFVLKVYYYIKTFEMDYKIFF